MNEKINNLIPKAIHAIRNSEIEKNGIVAKEYKGYISSMGASIIQAGLLATLAFYQNDSNKKADSSKVLKALFEMIRSGNTVDNNLIQYVINNSSNENIAGDFVSEENLVFDKLYLIEEEISDALIALKLALRTFKIDE